MQPSVRPSRRERKRSEARAEICGRARAVLADAGAEAITLRGLAADLGMAPTGVHYYFASRNDLLAALIVEAFEGIAILVGEARAGQAGPLLEWRAGAKAYYRWATANPDLFHLAHSRIATRLKNRPGLLDARGAAVRALMDPLTAAAEAGEVDIPDAGFLPAELKRRLVDWAAAANVLPDPASQLLGLRAYTLLHGHIQLVVTESLPRELLRDDTLLDAQLDLLLAGPAQAVRARYAGAGDA